MWDQVVIARKELPVGMLALSGAIQTVHQESPRQSLGQVPVTETGSNPIEDLEGVGFNAVIR